MSDIDALVDDLTARLKAAGVTQMKPVSVVENDRIADWHLKIGHPKYGEMLLSGERIAKWQGTPLWPLLHELQPFRYTVMVAALDKHLSRLMRQMSDMERQGMTETEEYAEMLNTRYVRLECAYTHPVLQERAEGEQMQEEMAA